MNLRSIAGLLGALALGACSKDSVQSITAPVSGAQIKFFNFAVGTAADAPGVNFYANEAKMTAINSSTGSESTLGTATGAVGNGGYYSVITPGAYTVTGRIAATASNGTSIAALPVTLADGKFYSFYMSGYYDATAKTSDAFIVEDPIPAPVDYTISYVRFVNASANSAPLTLYAKNSVGGAEVAIGGSVAYKTAGAFIQVATGVYDLNARAGGSTANVVSRTAVNFLPGRVYTIGAFGDATVSTATAANRIRLDNTTNW